MHRSLGRKIGNRTSLLRNLATSLVLYEKMTTTLPKAKEVMPIVEHLINIGKAGDVNARRRLQAYFFDENAAIKVMEDLAPRYKDTKSGFIKIYKLGTRLGDNAEKALIVLKPKKLEKIEEDIKEKDNGNQKADKAKIETTTKKSTSKNNK